MHRGLGPGEPALALEGGDQAVVLGDLGEVAVGQQVEPGVADVDHGDGVAAVGVDQGHGAQGGAHAGELVVGSADRSTSARLASCTAVTSTSVPAAVNALAAGCRTASWLATSPALWPPMPSATAKRPSTASSESSLAWRTGPVSVAAPQAKRVTAAPSRCCRSGGGHPAAATIGPETLWRLSQVPLVEPRSSTSHCPSRVNTRAWICEA